MRIEYIKISNILSFKYQSDINMAEAIPFDEGLNILIGENGAGKSTVLEIINFIFRKILFVPYNINQDLYQNRDQYNVGDKQEILKHYQPEKRYNGFRLEPNWNTENKEQKIQIKVLIDDIDKNNLQTLENNKDYLQKFAGKYSRISEIDFSHPNDSFIINIDLDNENKQFSYTVDNDDGGFKYLTNYNYYRKLIDLCNQELGKEIEPLKETFTLISGYRNYSSFSKQVSLNNDASVQIQNIRNNEFSRSTNSSDQAEPPIFNLVRLMVASLHMEDVFSNLDEEQVAIKVNQTPFLKSINEKLKLINLKVEISLENRNSWAYSFRFIDLDNGKVLSDINSLSAGQKSIVHLIFEAYGRGELKGGLVIIDEPEIHLHYQFQYEYLRVIESLNSDQNSQYILVTHSEALISSETIGKVKRLALDNTRSTVVKVPNINTDQRTLIKILDNTRSTYAFFAKKVVLVEGDTDRYFFKAIFQKLKPELNQEIAILDIGGKGNYTNWKDFFVEFGLEVFYVGDFDNIFTLEYEGETIISQADKNTIQNNIKANQLANLPDDKKDRLKQKYETLVQDSDFLSNLKLSTWQPFVDLAKSFFKVERKEIFKAVKSNTSDLQEKIESLYDHKIFILKNGTLEDYTGTSSKKLDATIEFCEGIDEWLKIKNIYTDEIKDIVSQISV